MAFGYLVLAVVLAITLNARARWLRIAGTIIAALGLMMMAVSIILADLDGTFAAIPASDSTIHRLTPAILNSQAMIAAIAIIFLCWSAWMQARRPLADRLPLRNDARQFGKVSRGLHWVIAVLMLCLVPIGLFMAILPATAPERADFVAAHQSLGLTVLVLVIARIVWLAINPPPPPVALAPVARRALRAVHLLLYAVLIAFPISGYLISQWAPVDFYGWTFVPIGWTGPAATALFVHDWALPGLFYAMLVLHIGAVLKRHFADGDTSAVRRMMR